MIHVRVRKVRIAKGIRLNYIAKRLGLTRTQYSNMEHGRAGIESERLAIIAEILGEKPAIFFDDSLTDAVIEKAKEDYWLENRGKNILSSRTRNSQTDCGNDQENRAEVT